jgi:hypothetical protein
LQPEVSICRLFEMVPEISFTVEFTRLRKVEAQKQRHGAVVQVRGFCDVSSSEPKHCYEVVVSRDANRFRDTRILGAVV